MLGFAYRSHAVLRRPRLKRWQRVFIKLAAPFILSIVRDAVAAFFAWARTHFDGNELDGASNHLEGKLSAAELAVVSELLAVLEDRAQAHAREAITTGAVSLDRSG